ncbi:hypothetical protein [Nocardioides astragali]|uniref:Uncharacterized protein n=1 Tax=Nocardioides astragali TaxID=1776736 RepID=A0ABW2MY70_9ACTN|nr:hypothetical protein [Nocardioides astragali]
MRTTQDTRPAGLRALAWLGIILLLAIGLPLTAMGLLGLGTALGRGMLCGGLALLVGAIGGMARELVESRARRDPPRPRLEMLDGRPALHLPRTAGPTLVSSWSLAALGAVIALGAVFTGLEGRWVWCLLLGVTAGWLGWSSAIHRGSSLAGGLWFTPAGMRHDDRGVVVDLPWGSVTGVVPQQPMPVLLRPDHTPDVTRTGPTGRAWRPVRRGGVLAVDTRHLAGGPVLASYVIGKAVTDPASRELLGSEASLPSPESLT